MKRYAFDVAVMSVCFGLLGFFAWHAQYGPRGFASQTTLIEKLVSMEGDYNTIRARRESLEARVSLLRPDSIDPDMLDEAARRTLGFSGETDIIVR